MTGADLGVLADDAHEFRRRCWALARAGDLGAAVKHGQEVVAGFRDLLGPDHPLTFAAEANAEVSQSALSSGSHLQANLTDIDFTPLPL